MPKEIDPVDGWLLELRQHSKALQIAYCYGSFAIMHFAKVEALVAKINRHLEKEKSCAR
jgi:hypothetical protein